MTDPVSTESYTRYRTRLLAGSIPATAATVFGATLVFQAAGGLAGPERLRVEWLPNLIQLMVPIVTWVLGRAGWRERPQALLLGADFAYTATLIARLALPTTSLSGTSLYVAVKLMATAVLVPWGQGRQSVSVGFTLILLYTALLATHADLHGVQASHLWLGPLVAGFLSIAGAGTGDRVRRAVFERERELSASAAHLRREMEVDEALARVGQELIALPDTRRILDALCRLTTEVLDCDVSHTYLWTAEQQEYSAAAGYGDTPEEWEALRLVRYPQYIMGRFQERVDAAGVEQFFLDERPARGAALLRQFNTSVVLCLALRRGDKLIGIQSAERRGPRRAFSPQHVRIARGMAHLASLALETARLVEELGTANRLKSEFVATMSHELRSPLNIIIGYHELLLDGGFGPLSGTQCEPLRRADRSARELLDLVNATLDLSRLEARRIPLDLGDVAVAALVEEVGREFTHLVERSAIAVAWQAAPGMPLLRTDRVKLKMVLKNLLGNAVKFTEQGRVLLDAGVRGDGVEFSVTDTGVGIPAEAQGMIFEPFRQVDATRGGAGLGLYIITQLLAALGGTITVESVVGAGSTFRVRLPQRGPAAPRGTPGEDHERPGSTIVPDTTG